MLQTIPRPIAGDQVVLQIIYVEGSSSRNYEHGKVVRDEMNYACMLLCGCVFRGIKGLDTDFATSALDCYTD